MILMILSQPAFNLQIPMMTDCPEPEYRDESVSFQYYLLLSESNCISHSLKNAFFKYVSQGNVSFDYYSLPPESNISNICPLPTPGELERLITIRCTIITCIRQQRLFSFHFCKVILIFSKFDAQHNDRGSSSSFCETFVISVT